MKKNGGPAFPQVLGDNPMLQLEEGTVTVVGSGMSLRDYFAAKAMSLGGEFLNDPPNGIKHVACIAYAIADAMIAEREK
jgi:hypothetical protein